MQSHYHWLDLTLAQTEEVLRFERLKDMRTSEEFTYWEALAFEADTFERILTPEQWALYQTVHLEIVNNHEERLQDLEVEAAGAIPQLQQRLAHYREEFIPALRRVQPLSPHTTGVDPKLDFILAEYLQFWYEEQQKLLVRHYREYRLYCPQVLQARVLRHELISLLPHYHAFVAAADAPTKTVLEFVLAPMRSWLAALPEPLAAKLHGFNRFLAQTERGLTFRPDLPDHYFPAPGDESTWLDQRVFTVLWLSYDADAVRHQRLLR